MTDQHQNEALQKTAFWLIAAGYIPFIALTLMTGLWRDFPLGPSFLMAALTGYGAIILSFLGGIRWGAALVNGGTNAPITLALSVLPSLLGWASLLVIPRTALMLLLGGVTVQLLWDLNAVKSGALPTWFGPYRMGISIAVIFAFALTLALMP